MATLTLRTVKGSTLTHQELDDNLSNLNSFKVEGRAGTLTTTSTSLNHIHDGTTVYLTEYGTVLTGNSLATFDADINSGNLRILVTPTNASSTVFRFSAMTIQA